MASIISSALLTKTRQFVADTVSYGQYKIGSQWYRAEIEGKEIQANGFVNITFPIMPPEGSQSASITRVQLCDASGTVLTDKTETITMQAGSIGLMYRVKIGVKLGGDET